MISHNLKSRLWNFWELRSGRSELDKVLKYLEPASIPRELWRIGGDRDGAYLIPNDLGSI